MEKLPPIPQESLSQFNFSEALEKFHQDQFYLEIFNRNKKPTLSCQSKDQKRSGLPFRIDQEAVRKDISLYINEIRYPFGIIMQPDNTFKCPLRKKCSSFIKKDSLIIHLSREHCIERDEVEFYSTALDKTFKSLRTWQKCYRTQKIVQYNVINNL